MTLHDHRRRGSNLVSFVAGAALACGLLAGAVARADVAPIDACTSPGQPCGGDPRCTCVVQECTRMVPCTGGSDGGGGTGFCTMRYECNRCRRDDGASCPRSGTGGAGSGGSGGSGGIDAGTSDAGGDAGANPDGDGSGCDCSATSRDHGSALLVVLGALLWTRMRRRREA